MPNSFFKFKQFTIQQDQCAMKVSTDACILGAYTAKIALKTPSLEHILDIGAGTGLLSLMLAQQLPSAKIDSVELVGNAYQQCTENIANSPWERNIRVYHQDIQSFAKETDNVYDLIIANPPFYPDHFQSSNEARRQARHTNNSLDFSELLYCIKHLLSPQGTAFVLLPFRQSKELLDMAKGCHLYPLSILDVRNKEHQPIIRTIVQYQAEMPKDNPFIETLNIRNSEGNYSPFFIELLKDYYLAL